MAESTSNRGFWSKVAAHAAIILLATILVDYGAKPAFTYTVTVMTSGYVGDYFGPPNAHLHCGFGSFVLDVGHDRYILQDTFFNHKPYGLHMLVCATTGIGVGTYEFVSGVTPSNPPRLKITFYGKPPIQYDFEPMQ